MKDTDPTKLLKFLKNYMVYFEHLIVNRILRIFFGSIMKLKSCV